jgi:hypothetical protein
VLGLEQRWGGSEVEMRAYFLIVWPLFLLMPGAQSPSDHDEFVFVRHQIESSQSFIPKRGYVPDKDTATAIAYAVAIPVYGKGNVDAQKPFRAELESGKWTVLGTLRGATSGGTVIVQIDQTTGKICYLNHSM